MAEHKGNWQEALNRITKAKSDKLEVLDLSNLQLTQLPPELFQLDNLKELNLWGNELTALPPEFTQLKQLTYLALSYNQLSSLPNNFSNLKLLTYLNLSFNQLSSLPNNFSNLQQLTKLYLSYNQLASLPNDFSNLQQLTFLNLSNTQLSSLPNNFSNLKLLTELDLSNNQLASLPKNFSNLKQLTYLDLSNNQLASLPQNFSNLSQLTTLFLNSSQLSSLPKNFSNFKLLTELDLQNNQLASLPKNFSNLKLLTYLNLSFNQLSSLPENFSNLSLLTELDLSDNQLFSLPENFPNLSLLTTLYLSNTQLSSLPENFSNLKQLTILDLSYNQLSSLPSIITQLKKLEKLKTLDLTNSQLKSLPSEITQLRHLDIKFQELFTLGDEGINLYGNEKSLQHPPVEIIKQGWDAIENYFQQIEKNRDKLYEAKLIFIGDGGAGKTSIMRRLQGESFNPKEEKTDGIEIRKLNLEKEETGFARDFCLHMWDFGGQEIYRDTHRFFLTKDTIYILVTESRKNLNDNDIYYWLNALKLFAPHSPVLLVKNKCEISSSQDIPLQQYKRKFKNLVPWAQVVHTSCTDGYEDTIENLHRTIIKILKDDTLSPNIGDDIPATWVDIRKDLATLQAEGTIMLAYTDFEELCAGYELGKDDTKTLAGYFFRLGTFVHYADNPWLRDFVFLDNEWLTKGVYTIVDDDKVIKQQGHFSFSDLEATYHGTVYQGEEAKFIELMNEFKICYEVERHQYLCPFHLPANEPEHFDWTEWQRADNLHFAFDYQNFMPRGILSTFIVNMHDCIVEGKQWKHGVIIQRNGAHALVHEDLAQKYIHIYITGQNKRDFLAVIADELQKIHKELNDLPHQGKLACHCSECAQHPDNPYYFKFAVILKALQKGRPSLPCERSLEDIAIRQLMGEVIAPHQQYKSEGTRSVYHLYGGNIMGNDSQHFYGNNRGNFGGSNNTYNENNQNHGMQNNLTGNTVGGNLNIEGNEVHHRTKNLNVDMDALAREISTFVAGLNQLLAEDADNDAAFEAMAVARQVRKALSNGNEQKAIGMMQENASTLAAFSADSEVMASIIHHTAP